MYNNLFIIVSQIKNTLYKRHFQYDYIVIKVQCIFVELRVQKNYNNNLEM